MATIEVRCNVTLPESIVLATQEDTSYAPISWQLANGDTVSVEMNIHQDKIKQSYQENSSRGNWYVNSRVEILKVSVRIGNVSADDLDRLYVRHTSASSYVARFATSSDVYVEQPYQEALEFGWRVVREIWEAVNLVLRIIRDNYGQHWLRLLNNDEKQLQNFLDAVQAEWREDTKSWKRLLVMPTEISITGLYMRVANLYLEIADWGAIRQAIVRNDYPYEVLTLLADSREHYYQSDTRSAIIHLNSAIESAVHRFLRDQLGPAIPQKSLEAVLKQSHSRLLEDWVLPLDRDVGLGLEHNEWQSLKKIQMLRREAGHSTSLNKIENLTSADFDKLVKDACSAVAKLCGFPVPKKPPPLVGIFAGGTV